VSSKQRDTQNADVSSWHFCTFAWIKKTFGFSYTLENQPLEPKVMEVSIGGF